jgi:hypothetical protein
MWNDETFLPPALVGSEISRLIHFDRVSMSHHFGDYLPRTEMACSRNHRITQDNMKAFVAHMRCQEDGFFAYTSHAKYQGGTDPRKSRRAADACLSLLLLDELGVRHLHCG